MALTSRGGIFFLPDGWPRRVRSAVVHAVSLAHASLTATRGWAANHWNTRVRLKTENDRLRQEILLLREEIRIKDVRMQHLEPLSQPAPVPTKAGWVTRTSVRCEPAAFRQLQLAVVGHCEFTASR